MNKPSSSSGSQLYALLPAVYRNRDSEGDLAKYLDSCGELLDRIRTTLKQRLADCFPDQPDEGPACQDWILPYFADLLDVRLVSPHVEGRRAEVSNAVAWRQRKGTNRSIEKVAEGVGQTEVVIHEGFQRVAVTPRLDMPLLPATALGAAKEPNMSNPVDAARHPGLPAVTVDFRALSRAIRTGLDNPAVRASNFAGEEVHWRQANPHGAPCFPGTYEDVSPRTVDLRVPDWATGHYHPSRVLVYAPPPTGFFPLDQVQFKWSERHQPDHETHFREQTEEGVEILDNPSSDGAGDRAVAVTITTQPSNFQPTDRLRIENLNFLGTVTVDTGRVQLRGVAASKVVVKTADGDQPVLDARDCLFETIIAEDGLVRLEHCTVMKGILCSRLQASDCIFAGEVNINGGGSGAGNCVRYSRLPELLFELLPEHLNCINTSDQPVFFQFKTCPESDGQQDSTLFGTPGHGVLHPATPESVCAGAEDNGEMGAYHARRYCLQFSATVDKLGDFTPLGVEVALIPDARLLSAPPELQAPGG